MLSEKRCINEARHNSGAWINSIIIRSLIPASTVPGLVAIKAVCYLGLKQIAMGTKVLKHNQYVALCTNPLASPAKMDYTCLQRDR